VLLAEEYMTKLPNYIMGFRKGFQTAMLVEPLRLALLKAREWRMPIAVGCSDADSAFESMSHECLVHGWLQTGAPIILVAALYREMDSAEAQVVICGETGDDGQDAQLVGGGRPGDVATPPHWNMTLAFILRPLIESWACRGFGFRYGGAVMMFAAWADDFTVVAAGVEQLQVMLSELASMLAAYGIQLKRSKSFWMANRFAWAQLGRNTYELTACVNVEKAEALEANIGPDEMLREILSRMSHSPEVTEHALHQAVHQTRSNSNRRSSWSSWGRVLGQMRMPRRQCSLQCREPGISGPSTGSSCVGDECR